jgi:hypothetical protein
MKYPKTYQYAERKKLLETFKEKVICVVKHREKENMSFQEIAGVCNISERQTAFKIYESNKQDQEIKKLSRSL